MDGCVDTPVLHRNYSHVRESFEFADSAGIRLSLLLHPTHSSIALFLLLCTCQILRRVMSCVQHMASSRMFILSVVELYMELSGTEFQPTTPIGSSLRKLVRNSSQTARISKDAFRLRMPVKRGMLANKPAEATDGKVAVADFLLGLLQHVGPGKNAFVEMQVIRRRRSLPHVPFWYSALYFGNRMRLAQ